MHVARFMQNSVSYKPELRVPRCDFAKNPGFRRPGLRNQHGRFVTICGASVTLLVFSDVLVMFRWRFWRGFLRKFLSLAY